MRTTLAPSNKCSATIPGTDYRGHFGERALDIDNDILPREDLGPTFISQHAPQRGPDLLRPVAAAIARPVPSVEVVDKARPPPHSAEQLKRRARSAVRIHEGTVTLEKQPLPPRHLTGFSLYLDICRTLSLSR